MNSVIFAGLFVSANAVLGDNKGRIACAIPLVLDMWEHRSEMALCSDLFVVCSGGRAPLDAGNVSEIHSLSVAIGAVRS